MKRTIARLYWIGVTITMAVAIATMTLIVVMRVNDTKAMMADLLSTATAWTMKSGDPLQIQAENIAAASPPIRVTFVMKNGLVLADSGREAGELRFILDEPEIADAVRTGQGSALRLSGTDGHFALHRAGRVSQDLILCLSFPLTDITRLIVAYGIALTVLFAVLFLLQRLVLGRLCRDILRQMEDVGDILDGSGERRAAVFPELQSAIDDIAYRAGRLNADLAEVSRTLSLRSDFVANASHEIRSPLTSIMGFAEMLDEGLADTPEEQALCISSIRSECARMLEIVEDILLLSRAEGKKDAEFAPVDVAAVASEVVQSLSPRAAQKKITLHLTGEMTVPGVEKSLWEILYNLTDNAVRYGCEGGNVRIVLGDGVLTVTDDGPGIEAHHLPRIFEQFYRVDETRDASAGGTGLGLSIVRALAEGMGGTITAESEYGRGCCFTVRFAPEEGGDA